MRGAIFQGINKKERIELEPIDVLSFGNPSIVSLGSVFIEIWFPLL